MALFFADTTEVSHPLKPFLLRNDKEMSQIALEFVEYNYLVSN